MQATMQDAPLTLTALFRHGATVYPDSRVVTATAEGSRSATYTQVANRAARLAAALARLGIQRDDRVATFQWNNQEHLEAYLAVPSMGAVLHTLNIRLFPEQVVYIANHAEDRVVIVDSSLAPVLARILPELKTVEHVLVVGEADRASLTTARIRAHGYDDLLAAESGEFDWPADVDERAAMAMCYTSGTTGNPKGVAYSHRSTYLHSMAACMGTAFALCEGDRVLPIVPMFHASAWGLPYASWMSGADLLMPDRFLQAEPLCRFMTAERPTMSGAVPTVWNDVLRHAVAENVDLSFFRVVACGGAAVPRALMKAFQERLGVTVLQAWGMTETSPLGAIAAPPKQASEAEQWTWRSKTGRVIPGMEIRLVDDDGTVLPPDGESVGEFEARGPWVTGAYYKGEDTSRFHDGWLRTGDVGIFDRYGFMQITDRSKDVIKSGGEWISTVELENALMEHPDILEAAVVGVPDDRWQERPLASVVVRPGATVDSKTLRAFLAERIASWQIPERWSFIDEVPRTSVGKFDKKVLRTRYADGGLPVETIGG